MFEKEQGSIPQLRGNEDLLSRLRGIDVKDIIFSMCHALDQD